MAEFFVRELTDDDFEYLRGIVYRESGIRLNDAKKALLQSRIMRRMRSLQISDYAGYLSYLKEHYADEIVEFINAVTTNKTDFFRESFHFEHLVKTALPALHDADQIRIWSAGCSTGEEPWSIAIAAADAGYAARVRILATDIDTNVLMHGKNGVYTEDQVAPVALESRRRHFLRGSGENAGRYRIKDELRGMVSFARLNLLSEHYPMKKLFHVIFCRNVVIYFDKDTQRVLFSRFADHLAPGGFLYIGHSENISGFDLPFTPIGRTVYKKLE